MRKGFVVDTAGLCDCTVFWMQAATSKAMTVISLFFGKLPTPGCLITSLQSVRTIACGKDIKCFIGAVSERQPAVWQSEPRK